MPMTSWSRRISRWLKLPQSLPSISTLVASLSTDPAQFPAWLKPGPLSKSGTIKMQNFQTFKTALATTMYRYTSMKTQILIQTTSRDLASTLNTRPQCNFPKNLSPKWATIPSDWHSGILPTKFNKASPKTFFSRSFTMILQNLRRWSFWWVNSSWKKLITQRQINSCALWKAKPQSVWCRTSTATRCTLASHTTKSGTTKNIK